ncbi:MAG: late competence development ComFB family protein [Oscillospiraceae bacterium]|nr:late competence development ComFB family protein [Oscillospiraceae bacterium]
MYRKIMPSISAPMELDEDRGEPQIPEEVVPVPEHTAYNVMELVVRTKLPQTLGTLGACECGQCKNDCVSLALNSLPCFYVVGDEEQIRDKAKAIRAKNEIKITAAIIRAVQKVMEHPRH